jgi:hypothetical protein
MEIVNYMFFGGLLLAVVFVIIIAEWLFKGGLAKYLEKRRKGRK